MSQSPAPDSRPPGRAADTRSVGITDAHDDIVVAASSAPEPINPVALADAQNAVPTDFLLAIVVDTFKALADPTRTRILYALLRGPLCVRDLALLVNLSESAVSHHLRLLRDRRLVTTRRDGTVIYYALDDHHLGALFREAEYHADHVRHGLLDHPYPGPRGRRRPFPGSGRKA